MTAREVRTLAALALATAALRRAADDIDAAILAIRAEDRAAGAEAAAPPPATSSAKRQHGHHLAALHAAGWALRSFAASPHDGLGLRAAAAMGLSDGLSGRIFWPAHKHAVEIEAYRMGHRAGLVVRTGSATS